MLTRHRPEMFHDQKGVTMLSTGFPIRLLPRLALVVAVGWGSAGALLANGDGSGGDDSRQLPLGAWRAVAVGERDLTAQDDVTFQVDADRIAGHSGCNRFAGSLELSARGFRPGPLASTRMACPGRASEVEAEFLSALDAVTGWQVDVSGALVLSSADVPLVRLVRAESQ